MNVELLPNPSTAFDGSPPRAALREELD